MKSVQECIAKIYYTYGLFCASHPYSIILSVICIVFLACYPLTKLPLPGNAPLEYITPIKDYKVSESFPASVERDSDDKDPKCPRWYIGAPVGYIQQIVVKGTVSPWRPDQMLVTDAFRAPLSKAFDILEFLSTFKFQNGDKEERHVDTQCLHVSELHFKRLHGLLPEFGCLIISPANLWQKDAGRFRSDAEIMKTIVHRYGQPLETAPTLQDMLFGLPWKKTGLTKYYIHNRQRTVTFAITLVLKKYHPKFTLALRDQLEKVYPGLTSANNSDVDYLVHIYFKDFNYFVEYTPLLVTYLVLLLYLYFSVRKIEMVKSKWGLAISAVATVIASLLMSVSICTLFGLTPTLNGGEIFPYLVVIIGLENVLVLTKSVVSTPVDLDVKLRVAKGLSKEGWSITKNLMTELLIILVGFFTFVPAIQEFCLFAVVGLLSDFFLQMVFFATVLSVDIRRMELCDLHKHRELSDSSDTFPSIKPLIGCPVQHYSPPSSGRSLLSSDASSVLAEADNVDCSSYLSRSYSQTSEVFFNNPTILKLPKRLRFIFFWARTRMVQRAIMVGTVIWIALIVYKTGVVQYLTSTMELDNMTAAGGESWARHDTPANNGSSAETQEDRAMASVDENKPSDSMDHVELELWKQLSYKHWPTLFGYYNISVLGRYVSILPSIHLSVVTSPEEAASLRHPAESANIRPVLQNDDVQHSLNKHVYQKQFHRYYPDSEDEFLLTLFLGVLSAVLLFYFLIIMYKCICPRNYAKWRTSWQKSRRHRSKQGRYVKEIQQSVPLTLKGHSQDIECLATDGQLVISACLGGQLFVWDSCTGECNVKIHRQRAEPPMERNSCLGRNIEDDDTDMYAEYHDDSVPHQDELSLSDDGICCTWRGQKHGQGAVLFNGFPDLTSTIDTDFAAGSLQDNKRVNGEPSRFDLTTKFAKIYRDHDMLATEDTSYRAEQLDKENLTHSQAENLNAGDMQMTDLPETLNGQPAPIWCLTCRDNLIIAGCGNGKIEFWHSITGCLKCLYEESKVSVMAVCFERNRVIAARLDGTIDFLKLETFQNQLSMLPVEQLTESTFHYPTSPNTATVDMLYWNKIIHCTLLQRVQVHQKPVLVLQTEGGRVVSASADHTLKVFRLEDCMCLYTLYGHQGSITALYLDKGAPFAAVSGSSDSTVRLWDLPTGTCVHKLEGHEEPVTALTCSLSYVISYGLDDRLCVYERSQGQLLHDIVLTTLCYSEMALLTDRLLVTGGQVIGNAVVCDYSNELRVTVFPMVLEKND